MGVPVDVLPADRYDLAPTHPGHRRSQEDEAIGSAKISLRHGRQDCVELVQGEEANVGTLGRVRLVSKSDRIPAAPIALCPIAKDRMKQAHVVQNRFDRFPFPLLRLDEELDEFDINRREWP